MQTEDAGVKSSHPHFKFKKGNDMNDTVTKGNAAALLPIGVFLLIFLGAGENAPDWHHDDFLVKDEALPVAVNYYVENALFLLDYFKEQEK